MENAPIIGKLEPFWETGTEGIWWSVEEDGKPGYEGLHILKNGDILTVFADAERQTTLWQGTVSLEFKRNWQSFQENSEFGQQCINNMWVHGFQETMEPQIWANLFFQKRPATLVPASRELPQPA